MTEMVQASTSRLTDIDGVGPVTAAKILGRTRGAGRFATGSRFANYAGTAPIEVASADRQLNAALAHRRPHQVRMTGSAGRVYYQRKITEGKTHNEALRCPKRKLAEHCGRIMTTDERPPDDAPKPAPPAA